LVLAYDFEIFSTFLRIYSKMPQMYKGYEPRLISGC
jgi:hypothetical protein